MSNLISIFDEDNNETLMEIIGTFYLDDYDKDYVCLIPSGGEEIDEAEVFIFSYISEEDGMEGKLEEIESEEEWVACEQCFNEYLEAN